MINDPEPYDAGNGRSVAFIVVMALVVGGVLWWTV